jgi:hypothetical protein
MISPLNRNLRLFQLARTWGRDDFVDGSGHDRTCLFWNTRSIQIQFPILADLAMRGFAISFLTLACVAPGSLLRFL